MGRKPYHVVIGVILTVTLCVPHANAHDEAIDRTRSHGNDKAGPWDQHRAGLSDSGLHHQPHRRQCCPECTYGPTCGESLDLYEPKFNVPLKFVDVHEHHFKGKVRLHYNSSAYPGAPQCPCDVFEYSITSVIDVMNPENSDTDKIFTIEKESGHIYLHQDAVFTPFDMFDVTLTVRNVKTDASDSLTLTVASGKKNAMDKYSAIEMNGYEPQPAKLLSRHKRAITYPAETEFTLTDITGLTEIRVGSRVELKLEINFPNQATDIVVELFAPDNETTVMIICNVAVSFGTELTVSGASNPVVYSSRVNDTHKPDMASINLGTVTPTGNAAVAADNLITITYEAIMIENYLTQNSTYWVSAGAEYNNEQFIWVGQSSFDAIVDGDMSVGTDPVFNVTIPSSIPLGSTTVGTVDMSLPYPTRDYVFKIFSPPATVGLMSICAVSFDSFGNNFLCGNDPTAITTSLEADPQFVGNALGAINLGTLLNKGSRDVTYSEADSRVSVSFMMHVFPDPTKVNTLQSVGIGLEVDGTILWVGNTDFTVVDVDAGTPVSPTLNSVTSSLTNWNSTLEEPFTVTFNMSVAPSSVASHYMLEVLAPIDASSEAIFSVCSFKVTHIGANMPCHDKDEMVSTFLSRDPSGNASNPDRSVIDFGYVTNMDTYNGPEDDTIVVEAVLRPLSASVSAVVGTSHAVTFGVSVQGNALINLVQQNVLIGAPASVQEVTNMTTPIFMMNFHDGDDMIDVMGDAKIVIDMTTSRNMFYDAMNMEFLAPYEESSYFHVCRVDITRNGKNMPCMTPEWYNNAIRYTSKGGTHFMDRASMDLGSMCNQEFVDDYNEDSTSFALYIKVLDNPAILHGSNHYISSGLMYASKNLWVGQLKLDAQRGNSVSPTQSSYGLLKTNSSSTVYLGMTTKWAVYIKIARGDSAHIKVNATSLDPNLHICTVRAFDAGSNIPCVADEISVRTADDWTDGTGYRSVKSDLGIVTNYGDTSGNMTANQHYDLDTVQVEVIARASPFAVAGSYNMDLKVFLNTLETSYLLWIQSVTITDVDTGVDKTIGAPVTLAMQFVDIAGNDSSSDVAIGEVRRVELSMFVPEATNYQITVTIAIPTSDVGKLEINDARIVSAGDNVPCVRLSQSPVLNSTDGNFTEAATFDLDYTCSHVLRPGNAEANTVTFAAYARVVPNGLPVIGETLTVSATATVFTTTLATQSLSLTVADPALFVDKTATMDGNETLIAVNAASPLPLTIAQNATVNVTVTIPPLSASRFLFDVSLPTNTSACMTVSDVRVIGATGRNVLGADPSINNKSVEYSLEYNDTTSTGQNSYVFVDLGIITNIGITYDLETNATGDDDVVLEFDVQMADCPSNTQNAILPLGVGTKVSAFIYIYEHDVQVVRDGQERADIVFESSVNSSSTGSSILVDGLVYHSANSTAELTNVSMNYYWPMYMDPVYTFVDSNGSLECTITPVANSPGLLEIFCETFYFVDQFTFTIQADVNASVSIPSGFSGNFSVVQAEMNAVMRDDIATSAYVADAWYPYDVCDAYTLNYSVVVGSPSCDSPLGVGGGLADCLLVGTAEDIQPAFNARLNGASAWVPYVRDGAHAKDRHVTIVLGNLTKITRIEVQQDGPYTHKANELTVEYSNDYMSWFGKEVVSLPSPSAFESKMLSSTVAKMVRIRVTNDTSNLIKPDIGVKYELYGCQQDSQATTAGTCSDIASKMVTRPTDFSPRSFVVGNSGTAAFVCDRITNSYKYVGRCHGSVDSGVTWKQMDPRLAAMIGYEASQNRVYGYANDMRTILVSIDDGATWQATVAASLAADKLLTWTASIGVPETAAANLVVGTPDIAYTQGFWGATYDGIFESNVLVLKWSSP